MRRCSRGGVFYELDLSNFNDHALFFGAPTPQLDHLFSRVQPGFYVIDVGANIGFTTLNFAVRCPTGRVIAYEPDTGNFTRLQRNASLNKMHGVQLFRKALGASRGEKILTRVNKFNSGMSRFLPQMPLGAPGEKVEMSTLDDEAKTLGLKRLDLIKIDVEGYEQFVVEGGLHTIQRFRPILYIELVEKNLLMHGHTSQGLVQLLRKNGYSVLDCSTLRSFDEMAGDVETDVLCLP